MPIRITGMNSGLDTESIITALTSTKQTRLDTAKTDQKKLTWKQEKWKDLNKKVVSFYNGTLSNMRFTSAYTKKVTTVSNESAATVLTGDGAMNATQTLDITSLAKSAFLTGKEVKVGTEKATKSTTLEQLELTSGKLKFSIGGDSSDIIEVDLAELGSGATISDVVSKIREKTSTSTGKSLDVNFDENYGRFYISSKETGTSAAFDLIVDDESRAAMSRLGIEKKDDESNYVKGTKAVIVLNGETYEGDTNTFEINGLTITANQEAKGITLSTKQDTSGIYDNIKKMITEYNEMMKELATAYNADPAKRYKMLTDDQRKEMSDSEAEEWDKKIKAGLLSGDETVGTVRSALREIMNSSYEITLKDGTTEKISLGAFGISTGSYFSTEENEREVLHIDGDPDDSTTSGEADLLKKMISTDPDAVTEFFTNLSRDLYGKIGDLMKGTDYSSSFTIYEDKLMASQYSAYNTKISDAQKALEAAQDKYYKQFSKMETALSKINSSSGTLSSYFGGGSK